MHNKYYFFIHIVCIALLNLNLQSATIASNTKLIKASDTPRCFDIHAKQLPRFYAGEDIMRLYTYFSLLDQRTPSKDEFESTDKYIARLLDFKKQDFFVSNIYAVRIKYKANYDADRKVLGINIEPINRIAFSKKLLSRYIGTNAFNVKRVVESYNTVEYGIFCPNYLIDKDQTEDNGNSNTKTNQKVIPDAILKSTSISTEGLLQSTEKMIDELITQIDLQKIEQISQNINIPITEPKEAKYLKPRIGVLLIFKPLDSGNLTSYSRTYSAATLDSPDEYIINKYIINTKPLSLWIYDISNGMVIKKIEYNNI